MTTVWSVISLGIASVLAGVSAVLLAQRSERREARAGKRQLLAELERAANLLAGTLEQAESVWWQPQHAPSTQAWDLHQRAMVDQLPTKLLRLIEKAIDEIRVVNAIAEVDFGTFTERQTRHQQARQRAEEAAAQSGQPNPAAVVAGDTRISAYMEVLEPSLQISTVDRPKVQAALESVRAARDELRTRTDRTGWWVQVKDMLGAAWPTLTGAAVLVAILLGVAIVQPWKWDDLSETDVAASLADELGASKADCALRSGTSGSWTCLVAYGADETCPTSSGGWPAVAHALEKACGKYTGGLERWQLEADKQKVALAYIDQASEERVDADEKESVLARGRRLVSGMFRVSANDPDEIRSVNLEGAR